ncbi:MAG: IS1634 family transposase [Bacteroidia bacterium]|nr:IS1634 family transposase [Bacteroidia bacterium]
MLKYRSVKTSSGKIAIQVYYLHNRKRVIVKHLGSASTPDELNHLKHLAEQSIVDYSNQASLFPSSKSGAYSYLEQYECVGFYYRFYYDTIQRLITQLGIEELTSCLFKDLITIRILEPASKLRSIELIETYFGIKHRRQNYYKEAPKWNSLKDLAIAKVNDFAKREYGFDYSLLFYDVTTLYFESFEDDELRKTGFSKDSKSQQPQIVVGLMVSKDGFPIAFDIFPGNTFEGHTILPVVKTFIVKNKVSSFTVVADAAMISNDNIRELKSHGIHYIVGARLGNLPQAIFDELDAKIKREEGKAVRLHTDKGHLICSFSSARYRKDKYEMEKQILKAKNILKSPSKNTKAKFVKTHNEKLGLNEELIKKSTKLLGIKGYYTDLEEQDLPTNMVIERYHQLYKVEQAFRVAKSDLETRPIFHFKDEPVKLHILICFLALTISKHIEIKTGLSIRRFITETKKVTDAKMQNKLTQKEVIVKGKVTKELEELLAKIDLLH